ncbi:MAG: hypothetical protein US69_C0002G0057 [candidate division TM6 bacterium GW2011_GWF2_38_10]|nr:MAG: hypothetical protein US69_C0002G0057 [candidate division TM6 bacterium GW2011_GWF2_38_10]
MKKSMAVLILMVAGCSNHHHHEHCGCHGHHGDPVFEKNGLYKIITLDEIDSVTHPTIIRFSSLDERSGFVHLSFGYQVMRTIKSFFKNDTKVYVIALDQEGLESAGASICKEANKPGGDIFPHVYNLTTIPVLAIKEIRIFERDAQGHWKESHEALSDL